MKTAVITGTSKGLGLETANHLLNSGWYVLGISRTESPITHPNYLHRFIDVRDSNEINRLFSGLECSVDLLINNAAVFKQSLLSDMSNDDVDALIDIDLKGAITVTKAAMNRVTEGGRIIFVNSVAGLHHLENQSVYCAAKHGLTAFAKILGKELRPKKIKVSSIHPGGINTSLWGTHNPYPLGDVTQAIDPKEIVKLIDYIINTPDNVDLSNVEIFPSVEWHS